MPTIPRRATAPALFALSFLLAPSPCLPAQAPQHAVVPAACRDVDALSYLWAAAGSHPVSMQTLIGPSHLQPLLGKELLAVSLRRSAADETFAGSTMTVQVRLAHSPRTPLTVSQRPGDNLGPNAVLAFDGQLSLPTSPPEPGPNVAWDADNVLTIPLVSASNGYVPFIYSGGALCVDILSCELPGQGSPWWVADAVELDLEGSAQTLGTSCSTFGNGHSAWAATRTLIPGAYAQFRALGTPGGLGLFAIGAPGTPTPLAPFGLPANCYLYLDPGAAVLAAFEVFEPTGRPEFDRFGATAEACIKLPAVSHVIGASFSAQWFDVAMRTMSNGTSVVIGGAVPDLDLACVQTYAGEARGSVRVDLAYVLRFEYREPQ